MIKSWLFSIFTSVFGDSCAPIIYATIISYPKHYPALVLQSLSLENYNLAFQTLLKSLTTHHKTKQPILPTVCAHVWGRS